MAPTKDDTPRPQMGLFDAPAKPAGPKVWAVGELTEALKQLIEGQFRTVWVSGEISGFRRYGSGHCYFSLKDDDAQLSGVTFRMQARRIPLFRDGDPDGQEVVVRGRLTVYEKRGQYQIIVEHAEPKGLGALQAAFEALKARLEAEGLFDPARKKPLPYLPRKVGVVTSADGAAVRDFLQVLGRRQPGLPVLVAPARVQGELAPPEIVKQLQRLDARGDCDVIVVTRGGGSIEDLWAFNDERVARAIAACQTPVISAVGHEVDFTIADFVADRRCPTPSAAAEELAPARFELLAALEALEGRLARAMVNDLSRRRSALERLFSGVEDPRRLLSGQRLTLENLERRLVDQHGDTARQRERHLAALEARLVARHPKTALDRQRAELKAAEVRLGRFMISRVARVRETQSTLAARLSALSPLAVLGRGYALVRDAEGQVVRAAASLNPGDEIDIQLQHGRIGATVLTVAEEET